jgi:hypothetical protein
MALAENGGSGVGGGRTSKRVDSGGAIAVNGWRRYRRNHVVKSAVARHGSGVAATGVSGESVSGEMKWRQHESMARK